jgi:hypothetical protein
MNNENDDQTKDDAATTESPRGSGLGALPCSEISPELAKQLWTKRFHIGSRRYSLALKIGHQSFNFEGIGTAKQIGWMQDQLSIALARLVNMECKTSTAIERLGKTEISRNCASIPCA